MTAITELVRRPTEIDLFRFSAATWNAHRIHYDIEHARREGLPGLPVHAHLHGAYLAQTLLAFGGPRARIVALTWRNQRVAIAGETLRYGGTVEQVTETDTGVELRCVLEGRIGNGELCLTGEAILAIPRSPV
jgi:hydroxyacyl-ACP dehydratase HTD2-like protein with hotdog domain